MISAGYLAKRNLKPPATLKVPDHVVDICSVSNCVNDNFEEGYIPALDSYVDFWKHNDFWFFDSPKLISDIAVEHSIDMSGTHLFYFELYEQEYAPSIGWRDLTPSRFERGTRVTAPASKRLDGYDVVTYWVENSPAPECSPLSCNGLAREIQVNVHCLFDSFDEAKSSVDKGEFESCEPGTLRILAVYSVDWPLDEER
jgi:hypothetical protein